MQLQPQFNDNVVELYPKKVKRKRLVFKPKPLTLLLLLAFSYIIFSFARVELQIRQTEDQLEALMQRNQQLQMERAELQKQYQLLNDDQYLEELARQYLLIKPGEKLIMSGKPGDILPLLPEAAAEEKRD